MKKKILPSLLLVLLLVSMFSYQIVADVGPKSSLTITVENLPDETVYMDLLVRESYEFGGLDREDYDGQLFDALFAYENAGWYPVLAGGSPTRVFGDLKCTVDNQGRAVQEYISGIPDEFRLIIVTKNNGSLITDILNLQGFSQTITLDFVTGDLTVSSADDQPFEQMALTIPLTLLIEGIILILYKFSLKKNWLVFLIANLVTQTLLYLFILLGMALGSLGLGIVFYILAEIMIILLELLAYIFLLKGRNKGIRALYAITANLASLIIGILLMFV